MKIRVGKATDVGLQRKRNEDQLLVFVADRESDHSSDLDALFVVADGMGGESGGDRASRMACERFREWFVEADYRRGQDLPAEGALDEVLRRAFVALGREIWGYGSEDRHYAGMGTTAVLLAVAGRTVTIAHVGDSRCYRLRHRQLERMTTDHSWVEQQVAAGLLTQQQAAYHPHRNILTHSLGDEDPCEPDLRREEVEIGDAFLLCSDGLTGQLEDSDLLAEILRGGESEEIVHRLVNLANERDGSDNVTVVFVRFESDEEEEDTEEIQSSDLLKEDGAI